MASINDNITVDFPFEEDLKDKCKNTWNITGSPAIKDTSTIPSYDGDKKLFDKAVYFNGSSMLENSSFEFGSDEFTIQFWVVFTKTNSYPFRIEKTSGDNTPFLRVSDSYVAANTSNMTTYSPKCGLNIWNNLTFCYKHSDKKVYFYVNGKRIQTINTSYDTKAKYNIRVGRSSAYLTGYLKHFRFYASVCLYEGDSFDIAETYKPILHGLLTNTERVIKNNYKQIVYKSFEFR